MFLNSTEVTNIITKAILETASGVRMWQVLRSLSDYCLLFKMNKEFNKGDLKLMPNFINNIIQAFDEDNEDENQDPN